MKMKKSLALLLSVCLILCACPSALAAQSAESAAETDAENADHLRLTWISEQIKLGRLAERIMLTQNLMSSTPAVEVESIDATGTPCVTWEKTFQNVYARTSQHTGVLVDITINMLPNTDNTSQFEIVDIQIPVVVGNTGYTFINSKNVSIVDATYGEDKQTVDLTIQFRVKYDVTSSWHYVQGEASLSLL